MDLIGACAFGSFAFGVGTKFHVSALGGFDSLPALRSGDIPAPAAHGELSGRHYAGGRDIELEITVIGDSVADLFAQVGALKAAFVVGDDAASDVEQALTLYGNTKLVSARVVKREPVYPAQSLERSMVVPMQLHATDPRVYSALLHTASTGLGTSTGGLTFPATFPATFGSGSAGGQVTVVNAGSVKTYPTLTIVGPVDNPIVDHVEQGLSLALTASLVLGDTLVVNTEPRARTVLLNGTNAENLLTTPGWFGLSAGSQTIRYRNNGGFTASTLAVAWRDADM
jgi:Phage tail protein